MRAVQLYKSSPAFKLALLEHGVLPLKTRVDTILGVQRMRSLAEIGANVRTTCDKYSYRRHVRNRLDRTRARARRALR